MYQPRCGEQELKGRRKFRAHRCLHSDCALQWQAHTDQTYSGLPYSLQTRPRARQDMKLQCLSFLFLKFRWLELQLLKFHFLKLHFLQLHYL